MDRRRFASMAVALFSGKAAAEIASRHPLLLEDARTNEWDRSPAFDNAAWSSGGYVVPEEFEMDLALYGNAYMRLDGTRVPPVLVKALRGRDA